MRSSLFSVLAAVPVLAAALSAPILAERGRFADELAEPHYGRSREIDVLHYRLEVEFDPAARGVSGRVSITLRPLSPGLRSVELDAGPMAIEHVGLGEPGGRPGLPFSHDGRRLRVELPRELDPPEELTLVVRYSARPRAGLHFVGPDEAYPDRPAQVWSQGETENNHLWFPCFDHPSDRATSEEIYSVPADWTAVGNGELLAVREGPNGTRSFHYRLDVPHVSYLISVAAGRFEKYTDEYDGIPVEYYVPPGTGRETALRSFGPTPDMLRFFSERIGVRYPYAKYAQTCVVDFMFGGMENISATTQTWETLHDARAALESDSFSLVAHEAAHQWWGNLVTAADWPHAWLHEGFASYWENLWREHAQGRDEFLYRMLQDRDAYLEEDREEYRRPIVERRYTDALDLFDAHFYPKGAWVLHMIRGILGDERFFAALAQYATTHQGRVVETADLRRSIAESTGVNLERFFEQWVGGGGHPVLEVTRTWDAEPGELTLHVAQVQEVDDLTPLFSVPLHVAVDTAGGTVRRVLNLERATHDLSLELDSEPLAVRIDPDFQVLLELDLERSAAETLRALAGDPSPIGRIFAARDLARKGAGQEAVDGLSRSLAQDAFHGVRIEAAAALGVLRGPAAREALARALRDPDARVRTAAAKALGGFRDDPAAAQALRRVLEGERAYGTYAQAVRSLASIRASGAADVARKALSLDSHREVIRQAALSALADLGAKGALETLMDWTSYGRPPRARQAAIEALPKLAGEGRSRDEVIERLVLLLDDPYIWARNEAMRSLAKLRAAPALARLERAAEVEPDARLRRQARQAVREIRLERAPSTLEELAAEVERLREDLRRQASRLQDTEKQSP